MYTVFAPNSFPIKINPIISNAAFKINVITDIGSGIKFASTITRPDKLPTITLLGIMKKYTAIEIMKIPSVMMPYSLINFFLSMFSSA